MATIEFADELIVAAAATILHLEIVVLPHTPSSAAGRWRMTTYKSPLVHDAVDRRIVLGNNDVHYVLLLPA